jgi:hypothetical protein
MQRSALAASLSPDSRELIAGLHPGAVLFIRSLQVSILLKVFRRQGTSFLCEHSLPSRSSKRFAHQVVASVRLLSCILLILASSMMGWGR